MKIESQIRHLHPRQTFRISRGERSEVRNVFLKVESDGIVGWGEASPNAYYQETAEGVTGQLEKAAGWLASQRIENQEDIARIWEEAWEFLAPSRAAQCALDLALWDFLGQKRRRSVCELVWGTKPVSVPSFCTIGISSREELAAKTAELSTNPLIKIKSDESADLKAVEYVRRNSSGKLAVDANASWSASRLPELCSELRAMDAIFVEQPLAPDQNHLLGSYDLPVIADESCVTERDLDEVCRRFSGFNIKLVKCGGLTPALRMLRHGHQKGRMVMVGCMLESSLLISAAAVIAQKSDFADLDGAWLLRDDPFAGTELETGILSLSGEPGLGISPR